MPKVLSILLDQNVPVAIKKWLSVFRPHWDTKHVNEVGLAGKKDEEIFQWAQNHQSIIITFDEDFADARGFVQTPHAGIIRLKIWPTTFEEAINVGYTIFGSDHFLKPFYYNVSLDGQSYELKSAGPDKEFGTEDDIFPNT